MFITMILILNNSVVAKFATAELFFIKNKINS